MLTLYEKDYILAFVEELQATQPIKQRKEILQDFKNYLDALQTTFDGSKNLIRAKVATISSARELAAYDNFISQIDIDKTENEKTWNNYAQFWTPAKIKEFEERKKENEN